MKILILNILQIIDFDSNMYVIYCIEQTSKINN